MEITETKNKSDYNDDIKHLINIFKFKKEDIELKGSSSLVAMGFYADYDFFTKIKMNWGEDEIYNEFSGILRSILDKIDCYFIEFKLQNKNGTKHKWFPNETLKSTEFKKDFGEQIDFCKIDIVYFSNNRFIEASSMYSFSGKKLSEKDYIKQLNDDIKELKKEHNYYKVLKRMYSIYKIKGDNNKLMMLTNVFNSELGEIYKNISIVDAIELVKKYYPKDALTKKRIEVSLQEINYNADYTKQYNKNKKILNDKAKQIYNSL